jgi:glycosyltransferase involved in cell wall biosynthesis
MRLGRNPFKGEKIKFNSQDVTVVVATYIPDFEGYFKGKFDALKLCLGSIWKNTDVPFDLMVVDNGSTSAVVDFLLSLKEKNLIQYLILNSRNLGKSNVFNVAFSSAPGKYIAYSDDDCFYYPNWLSKHTKVFETFPNVGSVSGNYVSGDQFVHKTLQSVKTNKWKMTQFSVPEDWNSEFALSIGVDPEEFLKRFDVANYKSYVIEKNGVKVFPGSRGYQFVTTKDFIQKFIPMKHEFYGGSDSKLHKAIDKAGFLRLVTFEKCSMHIGNVVTEDWINKANKFDISLDNIDKSNNGSIKMYKPWYVKNRLVFRILKKIYDKLFKLIYS